MGIVELKQRQKQIQVQQAVTAKKIDWNQNTGRVQTAVDPLTRLNANLQKLEKLQGQLSFVMNEVGDLVKRRF